MDDKSAEESPSCCWAPTSDGEGAAPSQTSSECCAPAMRSTKRAKMLVFLAVLIAAGAVLAHALYKRPGTDAPGLWGLELKSFASLDEFLAKRPDKDAVFILLPGEDRTRARAAARQIEAAVKKAQSRGKAVGAFTLRNDVADHARLVERLSIPSFPCVVAMGRGCGSKAVWGEITEARLLQAFVIASTPSSCGPSAASGCCPPANR